MEHAFVCHYDEIALKGKNRSYFEDQLIRNIKKNVGAGGVRIKKLYGRILVMCAGATSVELIRDVLDHTFGIVSFSEAFVCTADIVSIKKTVSHSVESVPVVASFRITTRRGDKSFPLSSQQINEQVGSYVFDTFHIPVDLHNPELTIFIEISNQRAIIYTQKSSGQGGLPVHCSGRAMVLLSGGFDSAVAAYYILKRGVYPFYIHFHSQPYTSVHSVEKVRDLVRVLTTYSGDASVYLCPFADIQKEIVTRVPDKWRIIIYRRLMLRIAEKIASRHKAKVLVVGDAIGQVASQTIENMTAIQNAVTLPVFRPLLGFDKREIMQKAQYIGTYDISSRPHDDCCSFLMPKHPETKARIEHVSRVEESLPIDALVERGVALCEKEYYLRKSI